jgi:hypothetical protein
MRALAVALHHHRPRFLIAVALALAPSGAAAVAEPRWHVSAALDGDTLLEHGFAASLGVTPAAWPRWRLGIALASHDLAAVQTRLSPHNDDLYATVPVAIEALASRRWDSGLAVGLRAGVVHFHYARMGAFGIDEEFDWGLTPVAAYQWRPAAHLFIEPWLGFLLVLHRQEHGELPMQAVDRTYARWPSLIRGGVSVGARF